MPVGKSVVVMGATLHGCELTEFLAKRGRRVVLVHNGPDSELGEGMTIDDLANLWPWFKQKHVSIWSNVKYQEVVAEGLKVSLPDKRSYILEGKNVITTQDWAPNDALVEQLRPLAGETYVTGSCRDPGLIADAVREGAHAGYAI
jgi:pyruvate/2-oxoglutarate dehydrogenase complex dihydrolipoamide dehydrogenase (E3) component